MTANGGEGSQRRRGARAREAAKKKSGGIALLVLAGAALLYGDGMITPAISVLSATEGLEA